MLLMVTDAVDARRRSDRGLRRCWSLRRFLNLHSWFKFFVGVEQVSSAKVELCQNVTHCAHGYPWAKKRSRSEGRAGFIDRLARAGVEGYV